MNKETLIFSDLQNEVYEYPNGHSFLLFEYCEKGNLLRHLCETRDDTKEKAQIRTVFQQILEGVKFLHTEAKMAHLNLRPTKILLDSNLNAKISDVSSAKRTE